MVAMATYSVDSAKHATLVAATVDTVTVEAAFDEIEVLNRGSGDVYITVGLDPADPTSAGDNTTVVPAGAVVTVTGRGANTKVKLISADADAYSVQGVS